MAFTTPNYGIKTPDYSTKFKDLGLELQEFGISVDQALSKFDYNGADPGLVLSRVAALETQVQMLIDLEEQRHGNDTEWATLDGWQTGWEHASPEAKVQYRRRCGYVEMRGSLVNSSFSGTNLIINTLPTGFRPEISTMLPSSGYTSHLRGIRIRPDGTIAVTATGSTAAWFSFDAVRFEAAS